MFCTHFSFLILFSTGHSYMGSTLVVEPSVAGGRRKWVCQPFIHFLVSSRWLWWWPNKCSNI